eukprot:TRINITY_DN22314_c0_g1_i1.p2 TRINITY_DN22314_c0_g1~~TRINITY_DN22314_c0_g1_i1.p2  ORF type:complete len:126 (-),score=41.93 TRINITY_DN22314_c0_g1_i1:117-494(-)
MLRSLVGSEMCIRDRFRLVGEGESAASTDGSAASTDGSAAPVAAAPVAKPAAFGGSGANTADTKSVEAVKPTSAFGSAFGKPPVAAEAKPVVTTTNVDDIPALLRDPKLPPVSYTHLTLPTKRIV